LATALGAAIQIATRDIVREFLKLVATDPASPLCGKQLDEIAVAGGRIHVLDDPLVGERYVDILARHDRNELTVDAEYVPEVAAADVAPTGAFAAQFVEVHVDVDLGLLRIARVVSAVDAGRILNEKLARSQIIGATVMGIGMATLEETSFDSSTGRITNATLGDYLIPVSADVPDVDVVFVGTPDEFSPTGIKGLGEVGIVGVPAAVANAVYHATGRRVRSLPITIDQLL
jgi:xanthine dehydrogenase YagR molybdenum-binding subunit